MSPLLMRFIFSMMEGSLMIRVLCSLLLVVSGTFSLHAAHSAAAGGGGAAGASRTGATEMDDFDSLAKSQIYFCLQAKGRLDRLEPIIKIFFSKYASELVHITALKAAVHAQLHGLFTKPWRTALQEAIRKHAPTYIMDHTVAESFFGPEDMTAMNAFVTEMLKLK